MTDTFRALCAELLDAFECRDSILDQRDLISRARTALAQPEAEEVAIGPEWQPCVKLPITVHVREQRPGETHVSTREGITPIRADDLIMRGVQGEEYPIGRELFSKTYKMGKTQPEAERPSDEELQQVWRFGYAKTDWHRFRSIARAVLNRWGRPTPEPVPGEVTELATWLRDHALDCRELGRNDWAERSTRAAALLEQSPAASEPATPKPAITKPQPPAGRLIVEGRWPG